MSDVSITEAKARLPALVRRVEAGERVRLTRHGKGTVVLLAESEYQRLCHRQVVARPHLADAIARWRHKYPDGADLTDAEIDSWRDRSSGRDLDFPE